MLDIRPTHSQLSAGYVLSRIFPYRPFWTNGFFPLNNTLIKSSLSIGEALSQSPLALRLILSASHEFLVVVHMNKDAFPSFPQFMLLTQTPRILCSISFRFKCSAQGSICIYDDHMRCHPELCARPKPFLLQISEAIRIGQACRV